MTVDLFGERYDSGARISDDEVYRYRLWRIWGSCIDRLVYIMLNPSTADAMKDDPTIRKCVGFAKIFGFDRIDVVNLYAYRATKPTVLQQVSDPIGPQNDNEIFKCCNKASKIVCAWGRQPFARQRARTVAHLLTEAGNKLYCLETNSDGSPMHPLYVPYDNIMVEWQC